MVQRLTILGSTGSIGVNTLDVVRMNPEAIQVFALSANTQVQKLYQQCLEFQPQYAVMVDKQCASSLQQLLKDAGSNTSVLSGVQALNEIASQPEVDTVMAGIVGAAGLASTVASVRAGKKLLLANKEPLVMAGDLIMSLAQQHHALIIPVDSEHNALFQCMPAGYCVGDKVAHLQRILLTASGGPFYHHSPEQMQHVTPEQACAHPNWTMGKKISVDCATLMNKGLEVIEAAHLFNIPREDALKQINIVIHRQSIVHSMVEYTDGSIMAQMGAHDMRTPIAVALAWPERIPSGGNRLDFTQAMQLDFEPVSFERFPCLNLIYAALEQGGTAPTIVNAANEIAVDAFLKGKIKFTQIATLIEFVFNCISIQTQESLEAALEADCESRQIASMALKNINKNNVRLVTNETFN